MSDSLTLHTSIINCWVTIVCKYPNTNDSLLSVHWVAANAFKCRLWSLNMLIAVNSYKIEWHIQCENLCQYFRRTQFQNLVKHWTNTFIITEFNPTWWQASLSVKSRMTAASIFNTELVKFGTNWFIWTSDTKGQCVRTYFGQPKYQQPAHQTATHASYCYCRWHHDATSC